MRLAGAYARILSNTYGGFEIEKTVVSDQSSVIRWNKVGFVEGSGTSNAPKSYSFCDKNISSGKYSYRLKQIDRDGKFEYSKEVEVTAAGAPNAFALSQNYPNPFNPTTVISYQLSMNSNVTLKVYDMLGREVASLVNELKRAGTHSVSFDASKLSSGLYLMLRNGINTMVLMSLLRSLHTVGLFVLQICRPSGTIDQWTLLEITPICKAPIGAKSL
jgi:hypothetical protein